MTKKEQRNTEKRKESDLMKKKEYNISNEKERMSIVIDPIFAIYLMDKHIGRNLSEIDC